MDQNLVRQEKRNSLRNKLIELIENGVPDQEEESYEAQFKHLGITPGEQGFLASLVGHPGLGVLLKIFLMRSEVVENRLKYWEGGNPAEKLELLCLWQALSMAVEDLRNFPKMAVVENPTQRDEFEENDDFII